jgi:hypothetical protein
MQYTEHQVQKKMRKLADQLLVPCSLPPKNRDLEKEWEVVSDFLKSKGFDCERADTSKAAYQWTGESVLRANRGCDLLHEYAHFCLASKDRLQVPGFGLGTEPDLTDGHCEEAPRILTNGDIDEETRASFLGVMFERELGLRWTETLHEHSWLDLLDRKQKNGPYIWDQDPDPVIRWLYDNEHMAVNGCVVDGSPTYTERMRK